MAEAKRLQPEAVPVLELRLTQLEAQLILQAIKSLPAHEASAIYRIEAAMRQAIPDLLPPN